MEILGLVDIPLWLLLLLGFLLLLYVYGTWNHAVWSSQGVPGPRPLPLMGNLLERAKESNYRVFTKWQQKYGRIVGAHDGVRPYLVVTDLDMIREIFIKRSNNFTDRFLLGGLRTKMVRQTLFFNQGKNWKRIRNMMTPAFSASKLKLMTHFIRRCADLLSTNIENKARSGQLVDVKEVFGSFTMDVIAGTGFGLETNSQTQTEEPFVQHCKRLFKGATSTLSRAVFCFASAFPCMVGVLTPSSMERNAEFFFTAVAQMVDERREQNKSHSKKSPDLLQMLVDAEADPEFITDDAQNSGDANNKRGMTKEEIMAQGFIVLIAGFETTATTLQYLTYCLTMAPEVQERVFQEIQDKLGDNEPTYESLSELKYLDASIHETLRMYPPVGSIDRQADESVTVKGIHMPAGCGVALPTYTILHDPEYFQDPDVFNPDRYLEENMSKIHPVTLELPFGYGPRKCIGMRLALIEIKFAAVKMFRRFRFVKCAETPANIKLGKGGNIAVPDAVIMVKAEIRSA